MANVNRVRNGGFEQSSPGTDPGPFWIPGGPAITDIDSKQSLEENDAILDIDTDTPEQ